MIDYDQLKVFNNEGVTSVQKSPDEERHDNFMKTFENVFKKTPSHPPSIPNQPTEAFRLSHAHLNRPRSRFSAYREKTKPVVNFSPPSEYDNPALHDVRFHISRQRRQSDAKTENLVFNRDENIATLRPILRKLPFERTKKEHNKVYRILRDMWPSELSTITDNKQEDYSILRDIATVVTLETYQESGLTVFGNTGIHMILKGTVRPQTLPYFREAIQIGTDEDNFPCPTPKLRSKYPKLHVGEWFGTLQRVEGREVNSKVLTVVTSEPDCQFLKISIPGYNRTLKRFQDRIQNKKTAVVQATKTYKNWPGLSVKKLAALITWKTLPPDTVIGEEGQIAEYIVFIRQGNCEVFKQVEAIKTLPDGRKRRLFKSVTMGTLGVGDSIGEHSILEQKPFACSVVATTELEIGIVHPSKLESLDITTRALLSQSTRPKFANMTDDDIQANFIKQEMTDDWEKLKHTVLLKTINYCGITPGYGKWAR